MTGAYAVLLIPQQDPTVAWSAERASEIPKPWEMCREGEGNSIGAPAPVILNVSTPAYGKVVIEASDGVRYHADLRSFSSVFCYPRTDEEWKQVAIDGYGLGLIWVTRFEVHVDQVIGVADRRELLQHAV